VPEFRNFMKPFYKQLNDYYQGVFIPDSLLKIYAMIKRLRNQLSVLIFFCLLGSSSFSQTVINTNIFTNTTWTVSGSPYIISTNLIVFEGVKLTIQPGVVVKINDNLGIEIRGALHAVGTVVDTIVFTSNSSSPAMSSWKGIIFNAVNPSPVSQVAFEYCKGMYANKFLNMDLGYQGPYHFKHCLFYKNYQVNYDGGTQGTFFSDCVFSENHTGLSYVQFSGTATRCSFYYNVNGVDAFENTDFCYFYGNTGIALSPYGRATNCVVERNNIGVSAMFNAVNNTFTRNIVRNNNIGLELQTIFPNVNISLNSFCNNTVYNVKNYSANNANLSNNCWCTDDQNIIRAKIYDGFTPGSTSGLVNFMPISTNCPANSPLPIGLIDFSVQKLDNISLLKWQTVTEHNSKEYQIERSTDGIIFNKIAVVASNNSTTGSQYTFTDRLPLYGNNYYRLKSVDMDGNYMYSNVKMLSFTLKKNQVTVYPIPAKDFVTVGNNFTGEKLQISINDISGRKVFQTVKPKSQQLIIPIANLNPGVYLLTISDGTITVNKKIIKE
jgi:Secretion system C-terminal sorting domain